MIDQLLKVLGREQIGKKMHAEKIREIYYETIADHTLCETCCTGMMAQKSNFGDKNT